MKTYFKNIQDWYTNEVVINTNPYPNEDKMSKEEVDELYKRIDKKRGDLTPKSIKTDADATTKTLLNIKIKEVLDINAITLIDITAHVDDTNQVSGIINYKEGGQHLQKRF